MILATACKNIELDDTSLDLSQFVTKTITKSGEVTVDEEERKSLVNINKFKLKIYADEPLPFSINLDDNDWELLAYEEGGFFNKHKDRKRFEAHKYTALLYIPSNYTGGEITFYDKPQVQYVLNDIDRPYLLIFDINMPHESLPVTSGIKYVFKTAVLSYDNRIEKTYESDEELYRSYLGTAGLED
jgi:hypothetical protein